MATSKKPNIQEGEIVREMTDAEYAQWLTDQATIEAQKQAQAEALEAKAAARQAVLDRLDLTEQEAQLLLGS